MPFSQRQTQTQQHIGGVEKYVPELETQTPLCTESRHGPEHYCTMQRVFASGEGAVDVETVNVKSKDTSKGTYSLAVTQLLASTHIQHNGKETANLLCVFSCLVD